LSAWSAKFGEVPETLPTKQLFWDRPGVLEDKDWRNPLSVQHTIGLPF